VTLRGRLTLASAAVVALTVVAAAVACYLVVRDDLRDQVDDALTEQGVLLQRSGARFGPGGPLGDEFGGGPGRRRFGPDALPGPSARRGGSADYVAVVDASGRILALAGDAVLTPTADDRLIAATGSGARLADRRADGIHLRVLTVPALGAGAVLLGRSLEGVDRTLARLRLVLALLCLAGTALAAALGRRTAARYSAALERLQAARAAQRQLIADASHELRTPVTALRTNAEVLLDGDDLPPAQRRALLADVVEQAEELTSLVGDVIELARDEQRTDAIEDVRLDALVAEAVERARRHAPHATFTTDLRPVALEGVPDRLGRAVNNLLDNAGGFSPPGGVVEVAVREGEVVVRDHGPGVPADELELIFDRFHRGSNSRGQSGSGLGLAIARQVAERHGGSASAWLPEGGGLAVRLSLPGARALPGSAAPDPAQDEPPVAAPSGA
jgi:two-component system sensor histidine kinase MprB